jgi:hypothetical protein
MLEVVAESWAAHELEESNMTTAAIAAGKDYDETVKAKGKGRGFGSPHTHLLLAAMDAEYAPELEEGLNSR